MPWTPFLLERFLPLDTTMYARPGEITREYVDKMLLAALQEAQSVDRAFAPSARLFSERGGRNFRLGRVPDETGDRMEVSP